MAKLTDLYREFALWTRMRLEEARVRARHLREAGLLSSGGRGRGGADVTALDCAHFLIGALGAERAINGPELVRVAHHMIPTAIQGEWESLKSGPPEEWFQELKDPGVLRSGTYYLANLDLVTALTILIEEGRGERQQNRFGWTYVDRITIDRNRPYAALEIVGTQGGRVRQTFMSITDRSRSTGVMTPRFHIPDVEVAAPIQTSGTCDGHILGMLSSLLEPTNFRDAPLAEVFPKIFGTNVGIDH